MPTQTQAVILAGGSGSRMPPLPTATHPKPLLPLCNRPLLFYPFYSLHLHHFTHITLIIDPAHTSTIQQYLSEVYPSEVEPLQALPPCPTFTLHPTSPDSGTADVLRSLTLTSPDLLILSADYVGSLDLNHLLSVHRSSDSSCTVSFVPFPSPPTPPPSKTPTKKAKPTAPTPSLPVENYALLSATSRLLALYSRADTSAGALNLRSPLFRRYSTIHLRSDLIDPHVYVFDSAVVSDVLTSFPNISSIKYELVPYMARRQHTLSRLAREGTWVSGRDHIAVYGCIMEQGLYARRASTSRAFLDISMDIIGGKVDTLEQRGKEEQGSGGKKKGKKAAKGGLEGRFKEMGEKVSVTAESIVGKDVCVADRVSLKKSVVGNGVVMGEGVKVNGSVVMDGVKLEDGVNLAGCIVSHGAVIGERCVLKDCRVAAEVLVGGGVEASGRDFTRGGGPGGEEEEGEEDQGFEFG
eukprot:GFKZ01008684.1.p1 GENE.GFKZ01008684.1~~GFKZ01008684.1.p1  ORF type:complete len:466 (+),score=58.79 GFKZ01008684.1:119-1516(+)